MTSPTGCRQLACVLAGLTALNVPVCLLVGLVYAARFALCTHTVGEESYLADTAFCWLVGALPLCGPLLSLMLFELRDE